jgi:hypothetical protein
MELITHTASFLYSFVRKFVGVIFWPYKTYFLLSSEKTPSFGIFLLFIVPFYSVIATIIRNGLFHTNFLFLLRVFVSQTFAIWATFLLSFVGLLILAELLKKSHHELVVFNLWAFTYIPTYIWFGITALLYFMFPPPRTLSLLGQTFSILFITFSLFLLLWKLLLYYLTLRIGLKMTLLQTILASVLLFPLFGLFSLLSYKFNIFRVPFV